MGGSDEADIIDIGGINSQKSRKNIYIIKVASFIKGYTMVKMNIYMSGEGGDKQYLLYRILVG